VTDGQLNLVPGASVRARSASGGGDSGEGIRAPEAAATSAAAGNGGKKRKKKRPEGDG